MILNIQAENGLIALANNGFSGFEDMFKVKINDESIVEISINSNKSGDFFIFSQLFNGNKNLSITFHSKIIAKILNPKFFYKKDESSKIFVEVQFNLVDFYENFIPFDEFLSIKLEVSLVSIDNNTSIILFPLENDQEDKYIFR